ncbi:dystrophin-like [Tenrec ecaudatus]|uniref:dystrophin-like n=1 Tax=Tenrec ecaudatus TaxID=94439 RepID=UPI003F59D6A8
MVMTEDMPLEISYVPSTYLTEIAHVTQALAEVEQLLNAPDLCAKDFEDLFKQEEALKNIKDNLQQISGRIDFIHKKKTPASQSATPAERAKLQEALARLDFRWGKVNQMYKDRQGRFDKSVEKWRRFHYDMKVFNQWLTEAEQFLKKSQMPENWEHAKYKWYLKRKRNTGFACTKTAEKPYLTSSSGYVREEEKPTPYKTQANYHKPVFRHTSTLHLSLPILTSAVFFYSNISHQPAAKCPSNPPPLSHVAP